MKHFKQESATPPQYIVDLSTLHLTIDGQTKLSVFPSDAIAHAKEKMKHFRNIKDPFNWFFMVCKKWCDANEIVPDWQKAQSVGRSAIMSKKIADRPYMVRNHSPQIVEKELSKQEKIKKAKKDIIKYQEMLIEPPSGSRFFLKELTKIWYNSIQSLTKEIKELQ